MKIKWKVFFPLFTLAALLIGAGCASEQTVSFNKEFNENFPGSPNYAIENLNDRHFKIRAFQGEPLEGPKRVLYMKEAIQTVADAEGKRRGWERWDVNYISESDQGWMHVIAAEVVRTK